MFLNKKAVYAIFIALIIVAAGTVVFIVGSDGAESHITTASGVENWGLSFQTEGEMPVANATAEYLRRYDGYYVGSSKTNDIFLTFDAGYENGYTKKILEVLKKHNAKAAFFLVGNYIETNPQLVKQMVDEGHTVCNHTYSHPNMSEISTEKTFEGQLKRLEKAYKSATGMEMSKIYRPPQGIYSEKNLEMAKKMGYKTVFWSLAYVDWYESKQPTREEAMSKLVPRIHPGAVVLLHSTSRTNSEILDELLTVWEEKGYELQPIDNLFK